MKILTKAESAVLDELIKTSVRQTTGIISTDDVKAQLDYHSQHGPLAAIELAQNNFDYLVQQYNLDSKESRYFREYLNDAKKQIVAKDID